MGAKVESSKKRESPVTDSSTVLPGAGQITFSWSQKAFYSLGVIMAQIDRPNMGMFSAVRRSRRYVILGISILGIAVLLGLTTVWNSKPDTTSFELAKTLMQAGLIGIAGAVITLLTSEYQRNQAEAESRGTINRIAAEYRRDVLKSTLDQATASYLGVKRSRRLMRALARSGEGQDAVVLAEPYDLHMALLNDCQLQFETLAREVETRGEMFSDASGLNDLFDDLEKFLGRLITEYEKERPKFTGQPLQRDPHYLQRLSAFLEGSEFGAFAKRFHDVQRTLRADLWKILT